MKTKPINIRRMWINQPSTHDLLHKLHGKNVLAHEEFGCFGGYRVYFLDSDVISMRVPANTLSEGWKR